MAGIAVSVSMGAMKPVLEKLATLMGNQYKKVKGLREEVQFLTSELSDMNALLEKMDDADELDPQAKKWRKDIIEMSYDIEDYIDDFTSRVGDVGDDVGVLRKASHFVRTFKNSWHIGSQIKKIKTKVLEASERRKRYMIDQCMQTTTHQCVDPRLSVFYQESARLVGIDSQKRKIVGWVMDEGQQLKMMSIVGFGGLGKTTLANEVLHEVHEKFDCKAIVSISQNPNILKLLNSLTTQLGLIPCCHACETQDLINNIRNHLQDKSYFIIVDDLWDDGQAWRTIRCAFAKNNHHSRVLITTRIENVATECCGNHGFIHNMKPLSEKDSRKLFLNRICESEDACPSSDFIEVSQTILKKCGGLPLAIITMASMIACQPARSMGQWVQYIQDSLVTKFGTNTAYKDMMDIIDFSYKNLPRHLKACFLYLGTYPEDHMIERIELVRRWVAEGLVSCSHGQDVWDVAESYFNELVNRSMIQPVYEDDDNNYCGNEGTCCRVHDMMLELILNKCREDNFISLIDDLEMMPKGQDKVIRRLTIDLRRGVEGGITVTANTRHLSQVRSVNIFRGNYQIPKLMEFKFMRVLFLDVGNIEMPVDIDLTDINHLSQLRYLHVVGIGKVLLPAQIRGLRLLETLNLILFLGHCNSLPLEIVDVPRLSHLSMPYHKQLRLPDTIGNMKSLRTLEGFNPAMSSLESITSLGELRDLSKLDLVCEEATDNGGNFLLLRTTVIAALINSIEKLGNLRSIMLRRKNIVYCIGAMLESSFSPPFHEIEVLNLNLLIFSSVPRWISHLCCLRVLILDIRRIQQQDFNIIGTKLTTLVTLSLRIVHAPTERIVIGGSMGFKALKLFSLDCDGLSCLAFEVGAMPCLKRLQLIMDPLKWDKAIPVGLQHLPNLKRISIFPMRPIDAPFPTEEQTSALGGAFQEAAKTLSTLPAVEVVHLRRSRPQEVA